MYLLPYKYDLKINSDISSKIIQLSILISQKNISVNLTFNGISKYWKQKQLYWVNEWNLQVFEQGKYRKQFHGINS